MIESLPIILNPASGPDRPVLHALNRGFGQELDWQIYLTRKAGDGLRHAQELVAAGARRIAVCGGDGSVKELAIALAGTDVELAILPGGTGNALATELGIPLDLTQAAQLAASSTARVRKIDLGKVGDDVFVLRASLGLETLVVTNTPRNLKNELGQLAYPLTALNQLSQIPLTRYTLDIDGVQIETSGVQCTIANSAQMGVTGLNLAQGVSVDDGLLDVIVVTTADFAALANIAASNFLGQDLGSDILHWQGRVIRVDADPVQDIALGGHVIGQTPGTLSVWPQGLNVVVPGRT